MKVVTLFCAGDRELLLAVLGWVAELGGCPGHKLLLLEDLGPDASKPTMSQAQQQEVVTAAGNAYGQVAIETITPGPGGNVLAYNRGMLKALREATEPFLWLEADCQPLAAGWLDAIEAEYQQAGQPFMGTTFVRRGVTYLQANAVFPAEVAKYNSCLVTGDPREPIESIAPTRSLKQAHISGLFQYQGVVPGPNGNQVPTFPDAASLELISPGAVLFHRCKDTTLMQRLREAKTV